MSYATPRKEILSINPYVGGEALVPGLERTIKLSSNEGAFGMPPKAQLAIRSAISDGFRYPDGDAVLLRQAIGRYWSLEPSKIVCGAGSDDLLYQLCLCYGGPGREIIMSAHGFAIYHIAGLYSGSKVIKVPEHQLRPDLNGILKSVSSATTAVFLANPNNPTGAMITETDIITFRQRLPDHVLLVIDAAYAEYVEKPDYSSFFDLVDRSENTVVTRTFSKMFGLGGVRLGWCYAPDHIVRVINRVRGTFNVSVLAQAAGIAALQEDGWVERGRKHNTMWRDYLSQALENLGIKVWRGEGNFILCEFRSAEEAVSADLFMKRRGIIFRRLGAYNLSHCLRVTVGSADECQTVVDSFSCFVGNRND
jgi:histidinol-phosphate aminotransferase